MHISELEQAIHDLPELYGRIAHESEVARYEWEKAEQSLNMKEAGETLKLLSTRLEGESATAQATRIKNKVIVDLHTDTMEVLILKSTYKKLELEADTLSKKIMLLCKSTDLYLAEQYQVGRLDKSNKPVSTSNNNGAKSIMGGM